MYACTNMHRYKMLKKNWCSFPRTFRNIPPRQHWAAIGRSENGQSIGVTENSLWVENLRTHAAI